MVLFYIFFLTFLCAFTQNETGKPNGGILRFSKVAGKVRRTPHRGPAGGGQIDFETGGARRSDRGPPPRSVRRSLPAARGAHDDFIYALKCLWVSVGYNAIHETSVCLITKV